MIRHIVMWKLKTEAEGKPASENALIMREKLEVLKERIPGVEELQVGISMLEDDKDSHYDVVLISSFASEADMMRYAAHPEHQEVVEFIGKVAADRKVVDYET